MSKVEQLLEQLLDSLDREDRLHSTGTEHERAIASQKTNTLRKFAREAVGTCPVCGGEGVVDSGGTTPWGSPISIPCLSCGPVRE